MEGCDILLHLASHSTNVPYDTLENCVYWNVVVPLKLFQKARESGIKKFVIAGTGFEFGHSGEVFDFIPVNAPLMPTMSYSASKAAASIVFYQWAIEHNIKLKYLRIFQVFGEGEMDDRLWPSLKNAALSGNDFHMTWGEQIRDFISVDEVVYQLNKSLDFKGVNFGKPYFINIGTGKPKSIRQFAEYWWKYHTATSLQRKRI